LNDRLSGRSMGLVFMGPLISWLAKHYVYKYKRLSGVEVAQDSNWKRNRIRNRSPPESEVKPGPITDLCPTFLDYFGKQVNL